MARAFLLALEESQGAGKPTRFQKVLLALEENGPCTVLLALEQR